MRRTLVIAASVAVLLSLGRSGRADKRSPGPTVTGTTTTTRPSGDDLVIQTPQNALLQLLDHSQLRARLIYLDSQKVIFMVNGRRVVLPADQVVTVQLDDETLLYNRDWHAWTTNEKRLLARPHRGANRDLNLRVTLSLGAPFRWQELQGVLKHIDSDQTIVFTYLPDPYGKAKTLSCPPEMVEFVFLGNESEYFRWGRGKGRNPEFKDGYEVYFLKWHREGDKQGFIDGRKGVIRRSGATGLPETVTEHVRADQVMRQWKKGDKQAAALKYTWSPEWAKDMEEQDEDTGTPAARALQWWQKDATELQRAFVKDLAAAGFAPALKLVEAAQQGAAPAEASAKPESGK